MTCPHCHKGLPRITPRTPGLLRRQAQLRITAHFAGACVAPLKRDPYAEAWERAQGVRSLV